MPKPAPTIIPGTRYTHLVTTGVYIPTHMDGNKKNASKIQCKCDCGNITYKQFSDLINKSGNYEPGNVHWYLPTRKKNI